MDNLDLLLNDIQEKIKKFNNETLETIQILKTIPFVKILIQENTLLKKENKILKNRLEIRHANLNLEISDLYWLQFPLQLYGIFPPAIRMLDLGLKLTQQGFSLAVKTLREEFVESVVVRSGYPYRREVLLARVNHLPRLKIIPMTRNTS